MIYVDLTSEQTICQCDRCGTADATNKPNGVVVEGWATGQLWIDLSLSEQRQIPLCFCPDCKPAVLAGGTYQISVSAVFTDPGEGDE